MINQAFLILLLMAVLVLSSCTQFYIPFDPAMLLLIQDNRERPSEKEPAARLAYRPGAETMPGGIRHEAPVLLAQVRESSPGPAPYPIPDWYEWPLR